jgi:two-component sensor histidine kinase
VPCAIIINELVTNSIKHAFNGNPTGRIDIDMKHRTGNYMLTIRDNGHGMKNTVPAQREGSLGMHLVNTLAEQLEADMKISNTSGTSFTFCFSEN